MRDTRRSGLREICTATAAEDAHTPAMRPLFELRSATLKVTLFGMARPTQASTQVGTQVASLLGALSDEELGAAELMERMGFSDRSTFRRSYVKPALEADAIEMTILEKPNSRSQRYRRAK